MSRLLAFAFTLLVASTALAEGPAEVSARATAGGAWSDLGLGWRLGVEGEIWLRPSRTGIVGFGLRLATESDRDVYGARRAYTGELYVALGGDFDRFRLFVGPAAGVVGFSQMNYFDNTPYYGPTLQAALLAGGLVHLRPFVISLIARGAMLFGQSAADQIQASSNLFQGGWTFSLDLGVGWAGLL